MLRAVEAPIAEYFSRHTMRELYDLACDTNLMLAPANSPREILASTQLASRDFFAPVGDIKQFPVAFTRVRSADGAVLPARASTPAPDLDNVRGSGGPLRTHSTEPPAGKASRRDVAGGSSGPPEPRRSSGAFEGVKILEFGSGAAGPIATRFFVEHGATVLRIESKSRPDFLRVYALGPDNPHGLEGAPMYDGLNVAKRNVTLNLKHPDAVALVKRLVVEWADAVSENFAPRAMRGFGLDYDTLAELKPDLVMISVCLNGNTGPHKDYPGFGGQGAALSGYNWSTGWPDRAPVGPFATITDSLAPRYVAAALAAGLHYRRRTGRGVYFDLSQVEVGTWTLSPWLLDYEVDGSLGTRDGNRSPRAVPHGAFPCLSEGDVDDRWVAIAAWTDDEWATLAEVIGVDEPALATVAARSARIDEVEAAVGVWTAGRTRAEVVDALQERGIEAVPVQDFADVHDDPQLAARDHFVRLEHPGHGLQPLRAVRLPARRRLRRLRPRRPRPSARTTTGCSASCSASPTTSTPGSAMPARSSSPHPAFTDPSHSGVILSGCC